MLVTRTRALVEAVEEYTEHMKSMFLSDIECMSTEEFENYQFLMKLMKQSTELVVEQAEALDSINMKLDLLLERE